MSEYKDCTECNGAEAMVRSHYCGVYVCDDCGYHEGLAYCYCGWSLYDGVDGRQELAEAGETIEEEEW